MLQEMVESGSVSRFDTPVLNSEGVEETTKVTRVGLFNAVQDGKYLQWLPDVQKLSILGRQPGERFRSTAEDLSASNGEEMVVCDRPIARLDSFAARPDTDHR